MKLALIIPRSVRYLENGKLTLDNHNMTVSWLKQWTVPNNYKQMLVDLEKITPENDPFITYAEEFITTFNHVDHGKTEARILGNEFRFTINVQEVNVGDSFWPVDGRAYDVTVAQMQEGLLACIANKR